MASSINDTIRVQGLLLANGGDEILASACHHQQHLIKSWNGTAAAATEVIFCAHATCTIREFSVGCIVDCVGDATITVDLKKNGTTVLSSTIGLDSSDGDYAPVAGSLSTTSVSNEDTLTVVVTVSAGTGTLGTGLFASLVIDENYV